MERVRLLLDTHALLWWLAGDTRLSRPAIDAIDAPDSQVLVSAVSVFEIATKHRLEPLPLDPRTAECAGRLPGPHRDPFDRLLIAQAMVGELVLVSNEVTL